MPLKVIIVGAGVGGPTAAVALARQGHDVTILERSTLEKQVGFAFHITPNSERCLNYLGIDTVEGGAVAAQRGQMLEGTTGELKRELGGNGVFAYRPQVLKQLFGVCEKLGVQIRLGIKISTINPKKSEITLEDGTILCADLIVGADGVNGDLQVLSWKTDSLFMILYSVDFDKQFNVVCTHPAHVSNSIISDGSDYNESVSREDALHIYAEFEFRARRIIELADPNGFRIWKLRDMDDIERWSNHNTVVIGDAAHTVLPFSFSGASMAIEDGVFLAELLPRIISKEEIPIRLQLFEDRRKPRVARVRDSGRMIGQKWNDASVIQPCIKFLAEYDTVGTAREALATC